MPASAPIDTLLHPTVQAALVAAFVALFGWWISAAQNRRRDARLRAERVEDVQRALLAEIRANHSAADRSAFEEVRRVGIAALHRGDLPLLPTEANDHVFRAILDDIPVLPSEVIDPVIIYYRQLSVIAALAKDFRTLAGHADRRAATMLDDYLGLQVEAVDLGGAAIESLYLSLNLSPDEREQRRRAEQERANAMSRARLPEELAAMRARLNTPSAGPSAP